MNSSRTLWWSLLALAIQQALTAAVTVHSGVPAICPSNRTNIIKLYQQGNTIIGNVETNALIKNYVVRNTSSSRFYIETHGVYLLHEKITYDSEILALSAFGYLSDEDRNVIPEDGSSVSSYLYALVYRLNPETDVYGLIHGPALITHEYSPGTLPAERSKALGWSVMSGDRVGVLVPRHCMNASSGGLMCPSHVNLVVEDGCLSALYGGADVEGVEMLGDLPVNQLEEVLVNLNVEVVVAPVAYESSEVLIYGMVALSLGIILTLVVAVGCVFVVYNTYTRKTSFSFPGKRGKGDDDIHEPGIEKVEVLLCEESQYVPLPVIASQGAPASAEKDLARVNAQQVAPPLEVTVSCYAVESQAGVPPSDQVQSARGECRGPKPPPINEVQEVDSSYEVEGEGGRDKPPDYSVIEDVALTPKDISDGYTELSVEEDSGGDVTDVEKNVSGYVDDTYEGEYIEPYFEPASQEEDLLKQLNTKCAVTEIPRKELKLCEVIGSGAFGTVYKGEWSSSGSGLPVQVAVKTLEGEENGEDRIKFLQEATIMAQFNHNCVMTIRGLLTGSPMMIVADLMKGDLKQYLAGTIRSRLDSMDPQELASTLLSYTRQIGLGMVYLGFKCFVHRDLAARNILVSHDGTICKIADFGLSRDIQNENDCFVFHGGKIPVKWTAPEALKQHKFSTASDVWSYGCVLYEIFSLGIKPFKDLTNKQAVKCVVAGYRLPPPPGCPRAVYAIMMTCWHPDRDKRPGFCDIIQELQQSDYHILKWSKKDLDLYSKEERTLGSPLEQGVPLYKEMQKIYKVKKAAKNDQ